MSFAATCLNPATPLGSCTSDEFVSSLGKHSESKCSCPSWAFRKEGTGLLCTVIGRALCTSNRQSPPPPDKPQPCLQGLLLPDKGFWKLWYVLHRDHSPQEEGVCKCRVEYSICSVCQVLCQPRGSGLSLDRALWVCCIEGQIGASGPMGDVFHGPVPFQSLLLRAPLSRPEAPSQCCVVGVVTATSRELCRLCQLAASHFFEPQTGRSRPLYSNSCYCALTLPRRARSQRSPGDLPPPLQWPPSASG